MPMAARRRRRTVAAVGGAVVVAHGVNRRGDRREDRRDTAATVVTTAATAASRSATEEWTTRAPVDRTLELIWSRRPPSVGPRGSLGDVPERGRRSDPRRGVGGRQL